MLNGKDTSFNSWINKKDSISEWIFSRTKIFRKKGKVELDLSYHAAKADLNDATSVYASKFATTKNDLASSKPNLDTLHIDN